MNQQLLFFFSALGAFNGLIVGLYFMFFTKPKHLSNYLLGGLFLALSVRVGKSVFFYFSNYMADGYIQFGLFACWLIGPLLLYYVKSAVHPNQKLGKQAILVLTALGILGVGVNLFFSWSDYPDLWDTFVKIIYYQWLVFVLFSGWVLYAQREVWYTKSKNKPFKLWMLSIYFGNLLICVAFNTANYTSYIVGALSFSFVFYALILLLLFNKRRDELLLLHVEKYKSNKLNTTQAESIFKKLDSMVTKEQLFLDADLSLQKLAERLKVSTVKVSQTLNEYAETSFNDYVNSLRISRAKEMITNQSSFTFEAIAMDCGFNSKSTFYAAFKKHTGMTPSQFRAKQGTK